MTNEASEKREPPSSALHKQLDEAIDALGEIALDLGAMDIFPHESTKFQEVRSKVDALVAEIARDCERYRWLREPQEHCAVEWEDENEDGWTNVFYPQIREGLDALIDSARAHSAGPSASPTGRAGTESGEGE